MPKKKKLPEVLKKVILPKISLPVKLVAPPKSSPEPPKVAYIKNVGQQLVQFSFWKGEELVCKVIDPGAVLEVSLPEESNALKRVAIYNNLKVI